MFCKKNKILVSLVLKKIFYKKLSEGYLFMGNIVFTKLNLAHSHLFIRNTVNLFCAILMLYKTEIYWECFVHWKNKTNIESLLYSLIKYLGKSPPFMIFSDLIFAISTLNLSGNCTKFEKNDLLSLIHDLISPNQILFSNIVWLLRVRLRICVLIVSQKLS